jgi:DNA-binding response OmpR family regulator
MAASEVVESERSPARRESGIYAQADELPSTSAARTVLVVDDEALVRTFVARALKKKGNIVVEADCAERAIEILQAHQQSISLLLSDVGLPGLSGAELVRHASLLIPGLPTLLMSATPKEALVCAGLIATDTYLLEKPFALADLLAKVEELQNSRSYHLRRALGSG